MNNQLSNLAPAQRFEEYQYSFIGGGGGGDLAKTKIIC